MHTLGYWPAYIVLSASLIVMAIIGRQRQLRG
jgi:hypothetical protein